MQPEVAADGNLVGDVGEGRRALVCGHHEVRIVAVIANDVLGADGPTFHNVVRHAQQRRHEESVASDALGQPPRAVLTGIRQRLGHEAALGADRNDDRVLHHLGLDQAQNLGAEILAAIRPAQAAAGHAAEAQVETLDAGAVDEHLELRTGFRRHLEQTGEHLKSERRLIGGEGVGPHHGAEHRDVSAEDPIVVQARDTRQLRLQLPQLIRER